jgi:hypothetical protein
MTLGTETLVLEGAAMSVRHLALARPRCVPAGATALGIACSILAIASTTAQAAAHCTPLGKQRSASVARADRPDGSSEVTEFLGAGAYRVTRCGKAGNALISQTVSPIADPDGGVAYVPTDSEGPGFTAAALYGDPSEPSWAASFRAQRSKVRASTLPPTAPAATEVDPLPATSGVAAVSSDACTNAQYTLWLGSWTGRVYGYHVNRSRFNYNDTSVASIVAGHRNWDNTTNSCGLNDITNLTSVHQGSTSETIHTVPDGVSVTDRGDLASVGCAGALACTWLFTNGAGVSTETDQRFNEDITFSNVGADGAYDFQAVATHETGHSIGLNHASSSNQLTMYPTIGAGSTGARTLAKGDVMGMRARYP